MWRWCWIVWLQSVRPDPGLFLRAAAPHTPLAVPLFLLCVLFIFLPMSVQLHLDGRNIYTAATKRNNLPPPPPPPQWDRKLLKLPLIHVAPQIQPHIQPHIPFIQDRKQLCTHVQSFLDENMKTDLGMFDKMALCIFAIKRCSMNLE